MTDVEVHLTPKRSQSDQFRELFGSSPEDENSPSLVLETSPLPLTPRCLVEFPRIPPSTVGEQRQFQRLLEGFILLLLPDPASVMVHIPLYKLRHPGNPSRKRRLTIRRPNGKKMLLTILPVPDAPVLEGVHPLEV